MVAILKPLLNRVVVTRMVREAVGGLSLAPGGQKSAHRAKVLAVGPGMLDLKTADRIPVDLKVGVYSVIYKSKGHFLTSHGDGIYMIETKDGPKSIKRNEFKVRREL